MMVRYICIFLWWNWVRIVRWKWFLVLVNWLMVGCFCWVIELFVVIVVGVYWWFKSWCLGFIGVIFRILDCRKFMICF